MFRFTAILLLCACSGAEMPQCRTGADCASGVCSGSGKCVGGSGGGTGSAGGSSAAGGGTGGSTGGGSAGDRKSTRLNSSHSSISYAVFRLKQKTGEGVVPEGH